MSRPIRRGAHGYTEAEAHKALVDAYGETFLLWWPVPPKRKPAWWKRKAVARERRVSKALAACGFGPLDEGMRLRYWQECRLGQGYDDAGGYVWRCWSVMLGYQLPGQAWVSPSTGTRI